MKRKSQRWLISVAVIMIILSLLLSACAPIDNDGGRHEDSDESNDKTDNGQEEKVTICHKTGSAENPYVELTLPQKALENSHSKHEGDIIPAPEDGCLRP